jgi:hypothetical protein
MLNFLKFVCAMWGDPCMQEPSAGNNGDGFSFGGGVDGAGGAKGGGDNPKADDSCVYNIQGVSFYLKSRYKPRNILGRGSFGVVW